MIGIILQFCDAYTEWDRRSQVGDVYLTPIMQFLGGHARRGIPPDELGDYSVDDLRHELRHLTAQMGMDAAFLIASLIRAVDEELVVTSEGYEKSLEALPRLRANVEQVFERFSGSVREDVVQDLRETLASVSALHHHLSTAPRDDQRRIASWREIMAPILARENREQAYREQWEDEA